MQKSAQLPRNTAHKTESSEWPLFTSIHIYSLKKKKKKETFSPLASVFSFPFREKKKKKNECNLWKLLIEEAGSLGYPYLLPEATNVYWKVNNGKVIEG